MSEFREDLLATSIDKKRIIKIIIVACLLIGAFAFSMTMFNFLSGSQRPLPNDKFEDAVEEDVILMMPPFPYNLSDFQFPNMTTDQLSDLLDALQDMFDGNIDNLDLGNYSQALAALMASETEVFRVYDYNDFNEMNTKLWRYESFDEYNGESWASTASSQIIDFYSLTDKAIYHPSEDLLTLKIPLTSEVGMNSMVVPSFFPEPYIMDSSVSTNPGYMEYTSSSPVLYADDYNCTTMDISFHTAGDLNMTYEMFGIDLPTSSEIDAVALEPGYTPNPIKSKYLQLKGDTITAYINNNDDFAYHLNLLNATISSSDNAFIVADKIRNYLQYNFIKITDPSQYNPAPAGYDQVEWFCEQGIGYWADFASAFCAFGRALGLATRFVDGFNSLGVEEFFDMDEGRNAFAVKFKNMFNWAEVYIPTDISGNGMWVQMDVYYDNYLGVPPTLANYSLIVDTNFTAGYRGNIANLTATLTLDGSPVGGEPINLYDLTSSHFLGTVYTNSFGVASMNLDINDSLVVGPHVIFGQYSPNVNDTTSFTVYGDIEVNLNIINPQEVNISLDTSTNIQGYVIDPVNNQRVAGTTLEFVLFQKGTNNRIGSPPFDITYTNADFNGDFNEIINIDPSVPIGQYEVRVDTNGSWFFNPLAVGFVNDSSSKIDLNVTKGIIKNVWFYINNTPSYLDSSPVVNRPSSLELKAIVVNETNSPLSGQIVSFYDYDRALFLGTDTTDINGIATLTYSVGNFNKIGPNLLYVKVGIAENYSYFILNEEPIINIIAGPSPREINRTATGATNTIFNIAGEIMDFYGNPISSARIQLKLMRGGTDYSPYLIPSDVFWTDFNGYFNLNFQVASNTPTGNYTLRLDFNGTIDYLWHPEYPTSFTLPYINTSSSFSNELKVMTPATLLFNFWIDGMPSDNYNQPVINQNEQLNLSVYLEWGTLPIGDGEWVDFYDVTQEQFIGSSQTINGYTSIIYSTGFFTVGGPHRLYAKWGSNYNYSYFIYNNPLNIEVQSGPLPREIMRSGVSQRTFNLKGSINDTTNGLAIKYTSIFVYMEDGTMTDYSSYLVLESGSTRLDATGAFDLTYSVLSSTPENNYTLRVEFYGDFMYSSPFIFNNPHDFFLGGYSNFTDTAYFSYELKVIDPENLDILLSVEGNPTLPFYNDGNPPETYNFGEISHIQVQIVHALSKIGNTVSLYDDFSNNLIDSYTFVDESGFVQFNISTNSLYAGLIRIRANYESYITFNTTYIVINETVSVSINVERNVIQRNFHQFDVYGSITQNGTNLNGLNYGIILIDSLYTDVSSYLINDDPQFRVINNGNYYYNDISISLNCPQGRYYILIYLTGGITESGISLTSYMGSSMSSIIPINITAGVSISGNYDTRVVKDSFYEGDDLYVYGYLTWDNGTAIAFKEISVTVRDGVTILASTTGFTDGSGFFNVSILVGSGWPDNAEVWVSFYPEDNYSYPNNYFIEFIEIEVLREP